jgi:hypothetical protein
MALPVSRDAGLVASLVGVNLCLVFKDETILLVPMLKNGRKLRIFIKS